MKTVFNIAKFLKNIVKYAGLLIIIVEVFQFAGEKLEAYANKKGVTDDKTTD